MQDSVARLFTLAIALNKQFWLIDELEVATNDRPWDFEKENKT